MGIALALYLVLVLAVAPLVSRRSAAGGAMLRHTRTQLYLGAMATSWVLALLGAAVLWWDGRFGPGDVGLAGLAAGRCAALTVVTLVAVLAGAAGVTFLRRATGRPESPELVHLVPRTPREKRLFTLMALTAGLTEEFVYRGISISALLTLPALSGARGPLLASLLAAAAFGLGHGYQEALGMLRAFLLGLLLSVPFLVSGSLLPGMIAHTCVDLTLLFRPGRYLLGQDEPPHVDLP
jgi:CAAX protease family protein